MLAAIDRIATKADLVRVLADLDRAGVAGAVGCSVGTDAKQSDRYILYLSQGGLGLPDRDYYCDAKYKAKLAAYGAARRARMLSLGERRRRQTRGRRYRRLRDADWPRPNGRRSITATHQDV